ncbi:uncharacterized protein [Amphiura filiformis]|uniref:uncharacterized protein n=1 Tax=Amphiura filiformis TaxID=82378 RepID=UPI003B21CA56
MYGYQRSFAHIAVLVLIVSGAQGEKELFEENLHDGYIAISFSLFVVAVMISALLLVSRTTRKAIRLLFYPCRICWNCAAMCLRRYKLYREDKTRSKGRYYAGPVRKDPKFTRGQSYHGYEGPSYDLHKVNYTRKELIEQLSGPVKKDPKITRGPSYAGYEEPIRDSNQYFEELIRLSGPVREDSKVVPLKCYQDPSIKPTSKYTTEQLIGQSGPSLLDDNSEIVDHTDILMPNLFERVNLLQDSQSETSLLFPLPFPTLRIMIKLGKFALDWCLQSDDDYETEFEMEDEEEELNSLCEIGFLSNHGAFYTFRIKSFQEECAGEYLANLANSPAEHLLSYNDILQALDYTSLIRIHRVLRTACTSSRMACFRIILRIVKIYQQNSSNGGDDDDKEMIMENLILLCLQLIFEGKYRDEFHSVLITLFPRSCIQLSKLSLTGALAYFLRNHDVNALKVTSTHRKEMKSSETNLLTLFHEKVTSRYVSMKKRLNFHESMDIQTLFKSFKFSNLISLVLEGVNLRGQLAYLMRIIGNGHLRSLEELRLPFTYIDQDDVRQMGPLVRLDKLQVIDISNNKGGSGLRVVIDALCGKRLQELDISDMDAPPAALSYVLKKLCGFSHLQRVNLKGNQMSEKNGKNLVAALKTTCTLTKLSLSISNMPSYLMSELGKVLQSLQSLHSLSIYDFLLDPKEFFNMMLKLIPKLPALKNLLLDTNMDIPFSMMDKIWSNFVHVLRASKSIKSLTLLGISVEHNSLLDILQFCHKNNYAYFGYSKHLITGKHFAMKTGLTTFAPIATICYIDSSGGEVAISDTIGRLIIPANAIAPHTLIKFKVALDVKEDYPPLNDGEIIAGPCVVVESYPQLKFLKPVHLVLTHYARSYGLKVWYQTTEADYSSVVTIRGQWKRICDRGITLENRAEVCVNDNQVKISMTHLSGKWVAGSSGMQHTLMAFCKSDLFFSTTDVRVYSVREDKISEVVITEGSNGFRECSTRRQHAINGFKNDLRIHVEEQQYTIPCATLKTGGSLSRCQFTIPTKQTKIALEQIPSVATYEVLLDCYSGVKTSTYIDERGGQISIDDSCARLKIPAGALPKGQGKLITIGLDWMQEPPLEDNQWVIGPSMQCEPDGLQFEKPVTLSLEHSAINITTSDVIILSKSNGPRNTWQVLYDEKR